MDLLLLTIAHGLTIAYYCIWTHMVTIAHGLSHAYMRTVASLLRVGGQDGNASGLPHMDFYMLTVQTSDLPWLVGADNHQHLC